jgi:hypothetical protein
LRGEGALGILATVGSLRAGPGAAAATGVRAWFMLQ